VINSRYQIENQPKSHPKSLLIEKAGAEMVLPL
jgi:hypothetical protein